MTPPPPPPTLDLDDVHRMLGAYVVQVYQLGKALQVAQAQMQAIVTQTAPSKPVSDS